VFTRLRFGLVFFAFHLKAALSDQETAVEDGGNGKRGGSHLCFTIQWVTVLILFARLLQSAKRRDKRIEEKRQDHQTIFVLSGKNLGSARSYALFGLG